PSPGPARLSPDSTRSSPARKPTKIHPPRTRTPNRITKLPPSPTAQPRKNQKTRHQGLKLKLSARELVGADPDRLLDVQAARNPPRVRVAEQLSCRLLQRRHLVLTRALPARQASRAVGVEHVVCSPLSSRRARQPSI